MEFYSDENKKNNAFVILISGKMRHGKDTLANFLKENIEKENKKVLIIHYADYLKYICKQFYNWSGEKDIAGRTLLQTVGENFRKKNSDFWVTQTVSLIEQLEDQYDYVIIPDVRYPNEILIPEWHFQNRTMTIRIKRNYDSGTEEQKSHISETSLDNYSFDLYVDNYGTEKDLKEKSVIVYKEIKVAKKEIQRVI